MPSRSLSLDYDPIPRQRLFHASNTKYRLYGGAMGGGKSVAICLEAIKQVTRYPGNRGYMARHYLTDFKRTTLVTLLEFLPSGLVEKHYKHDTKITLKNGSEIVYGGLGSDEDLERIKSMSLGFFAIDEATEASEEYFLMLASRLRWVCRNGKRPRYTGVLASNPEPGWVKDRFVDQQRPNHEFIPALPKDNPYLPEDYDETLRSDFPEEWVARYLDGSWNVFEGQVFREFVREYHVKEFMEISPHWNTFRVIDHGYRNPTACLYFAVDHDERLWVYAEHYEREKTVAENAELIKVLDPSFDGLTYIDPSCFAKTQHTGARISSIADEYRENGIHCLSPYASDGKMREGLGINLVKKRFTQKSIFLHAGCANTIREILSLKWKRLRSGNENQSDPEVPIDRNNHTTDCLRYACAVRPPASAKPKEKQWEEYIRERSREIRGETETFQIGAQPMRRHRQW